MFVNAITIVFGIINLRWFNIMLVKVVTIVFDIIKLERFK